MGITLSQFGRKLATLTPREREVVDLIIAGLPNKGIASRLGIAERAVELRRANTLRKLQVHSVVELVRLLTQYESQLALPATESRRPDRSEGDRPPL